MKAIDLRAINRKTKSLYRIRKKCNWYSYPPYYYILLSIIGLFIMFWSSINSSFFLFLSIVFPILLVFTIFVMNPWLNALKQKHLASKPPKSIFKHWYSEKLKVEERELFEKEVFKPKMKNEEKVTLIDAYIELIDFDSVNRKIDLSKLFGIKSFVSYALIIWGGILTFQMEKGESIGEKLLDSAPLLRIILTGLILIRVVSLLVDNFFLNSFLYKNKEVKERLLELKVYYLRHPNK